MSTEVTVKQSPSFTFEQLKQLAISVTRSKLFGVKTEDEALSLLLIAQAEGRHPALAVRDYHIIQGRPSLKADTMLARFQAAGGKVDWKKYTDNECVGVFSHPQAGSVTVEWTMERAARAGLTGKEVWKHYARAMLRARCISEGVRTCFPGIAVGLYTPEEISSGNEEIDITPTKSEGAITAAVESAVHALTVEEIEEYVTDMGDAETLADLQEEYMRAHNRARNAKDAKAHARFKECYALREADIKRQADESEARP
jgi:hypothetical protein